MTALDKTIGNLTFSTDSLFFVTQLEDKCTFEQWTRIPNQPSAFRIFTIIAVLTILVILVVIGNSLVIAAVMMRRRLRSATGLLILSLAVADLLVGLLVLPFSIANEVLNSFWIFGDYWCTAWLTMDIWMCTSSIYNLVAISIDRYIAIIKPLNYPMLITKFRARCIVAIVWIVSFFICSPSFLLASSQKKKQTDTFDPNECKCTPSNSGMAYILFSASSSFYIPMIIVVCVYVKIYLAASAATKSVYSGMMQITTTAISNKTPKDVLMQNPSALSRASNLPTFRCTDNNHTKLDENNANDSPASISRKQLNGSYSNVAYTYKSNTSTKMHKTKKLQHAATVADFKIPFQIDHVQNEKIILHRSTEDVKRKASGTVIPQAPIIRLEECIGGADSSTNSVDEKRSHLDEQYRIIDEFSENETLLPTKIKDEKLDEQTTLSDIKPLMKPTSQKNQDPKRRGRNFGINLLSRLVGRGPRRRAGCVYEKRLSLEIKAAKTVAIVTGCFIFCWLGFAILYGISFYLTPNDIIWSIVFWLGYLNSALNPIIYTVFNREFRMCFKKLLTCNHSLFRIDRSESTSYYQRSRQQITTAIPADGYHSVALTPKHSKRLSSPMETSES